MAIPGHVNKGEMRSSLESMQSLIEHYFSFKSTARRNPRKPRDGLLYSAGANDKSIHQLVEETKNKQNYSLYYGYRNEKNSKNNGIRDDFLLRIIFLYP